MIVIVTVVPVVIIISWLRDGCEGSPANQDLRKSDVAPCFF